MASNVSYHISQPLSHMDNKFYPFNVPISIAHPQIIILKQHDENDNNNNKERAEKRKTAQDIFSHSL